ncbi:MAG: hypothetical protein DWI22_11480 [Planctomycetota bacterium]|nr:MAG: hypothetical protein DWI22_11480 [Planctomycetota bacterium]
MNAALPPRLQRCRRIFHLPTPDYPSIDAPETCYTNFLKAFSQTNQLMLMPSAFLSTDQRNFHLFSL